jgi:hypothetical protein
MKNSLLSSALIMPAPCHFINGFNIIGVAKHQAKISDRYVDEVMIERPI